MDVLKRNAVVNYPTGVTMLNTVENGKSGKCEYYKISKNLTPSPGIIGMYLRICVPCRCNWYLYLMYTYITVQVGPY